MRRVVSLAVLAAFYLYFYHQGPVFSGEYKILGLNAAPEATVVGFTATGYESLRGLLKKGYADGDDLGSQVSVYVGGNLVAELAGGFTDKTYSTQYNINTLQQVFSSSKFVTSMVFLHLIDTGRLKLSDPVVKYWPEFGEGGKEHVTVGLLLQHHGGVAFLDKERVPTLEEMLDLDVLAAKIAGQPHNFGGKPVSAYHAVTRGWYLNEVARRATGGMSVRQIMYKEILPKLNGGNKVFGVEDPLSNGSFPYEFHYGIPDTPEALAHSVRSRVVQLDSSPIWYRLVHILTPAWVSKLFGQGSVPTALIKAVFLKGSVQNKALFGSGPAFVHNKMFPWSYNDPTSRRSESPSFNGLTNARTLARIAELVRRSKTTHAFVSPATFNASFATRPPGIDRVINREITFAKIGIGYFTKGFGIGTKWETGTTERFYGWSGAGGSLVWFELDYGISFAFTPNYSGLQAVGDQRSWRLIGEVLRIVKEKRKKEVVEENFVDEHNEVNENGKDEL